MSGTKPRGFWLNLDTAPHAQSDPHLQSTSQFYRRKMSITCVASILCARSCSDPLLAFLCATATWASFVIVHASRNWTTCAVIEFLSNTPSFCLASPYPDSNTILNFPPQAHPMVRLFANFLRLPCFPAKVMKAPYGKSMLRFHQIDVIFLRSSDVIYPAFSAAHSCEDGFSVHWILVASCLVSLGMKSCKLPIIDEWFPCS